MDIRTVRVQERPTSQGPEYVPANDAAALVCALTQTNRINKRAIEILKSYGVEVLVQSVAEKQL